MKKLAAVFILSVFVVFLSPFQLQSKEKNKSLLGEWIFEVSDAPDGYNKGSLIFSNKEGQTICVVKLEAGELAVSNLKVTKDEISFTTYVGSDPVNVFLTRDDDKLTGKVESPEGPKSMKAVKKNE
ncbi:MAG TPA: hypothetical protein VGK10_13190 [Prolixibacteraceae bacterium]|jgi:hypothetical protein